MKLDDSEPSALQQTHKSYPPWLPLVMRSPGMPSIALGVYHSSDTESTLPRVVPLLCVYPEEVITSGTTSDVPTYRWHQFEYSFGQPISPKEEDSLPSNHSSFNISTGTFSRPMLPEVRFLDTFRIPVEIFEHIIRDISQTDVKNLRLVDKAFERGVSRALFETVVVPFGTEIYGISSTLGTGPQGLGKHRDAPGSGSDVSRESTWKEAFIPGTDGENHGHRMHMFKQFGSHIRQFGMSLEVRPEHLVNLAEKFMDKPHPTYWGAYDWPMKQYSRYVNRARLENMADETSTMKAAFSYLTSVKHLALSIDSGVGWIKGPDTSMRSIILERPSSAFRSLHFERSEPTFIAQRRLWSLLEESYARAGDRTKLRYAELKRLQVNANDVAFLKERQTTYGRMLAKQSLVLLSREQLSVDDPLASSRKEDGFAHDLSSTSTNLSRQFNQESASFDLDVLRSWDLSDDDAELFPSSSVSSIRAYSTTNLASGATKDSDLNSDILITAPIADDLSVSAQFNKKLIPTSLTQGQMEWLIESAWVQDAFLSSYIIAVESFSNVRALTFSRLSSKFLPKFLRHDFWKSLPALSTLKLCVIADWLNVETNEAGFMASRLLCPSDAIEPFQCLLGEHIAQNPTITRLSIGWAEGGEHAEGLLARNKHLLPAPIMERSLSVLPDSTAQLSFPYVQHLVLENCWITPNVLMEFVTRHARHILTGMTLDSVSLTTHPKFANALHNNNHAVFANLLAQPPPLAPMGAANSTAPQQHVVTVANAAPVVAVTTATELREGSWPDVLALIGKHCKNTDRPGPEITFRSCGHALLLKQKTLDQSALTDAPVTLIAADSLNTSSSWFEDRRGALLRSQMMLLDNDPFHGSIIAGMPELEMKALQTDWGLRMGWPSKEFLDQGYDDEDGWGRFGEKMQDAAIYDGHFRGGTGRFSGRVVFRTGDGDEEE